MLTPWLCCAQNRIDTIYFDENWKAVRHKTFAEYFRVAMYPEKIFRDFYITGELQAKGSFLSLDNSDDSKSVFDGEVVGYKKDGTITNCRRFKDGLMDGIQTFFTDDGICIQHLYEKGKPACDYYVASNGNGLLSKLRYTDNNQYEPYIENPTPSEAADIKYMENSGYNWAYYQMNGVGVYQTCVENDEYGTWHRLITVIVNNTLLPIEFDPHQMWVTGHHTRKKRKLEIELCQVEDYMRTVGGWQKFQSVCGAVGQAIENINAGYSVQTTVCNTTYSGSLYSSGSAYAYGTGGSAYATYSGSSHYKERSQTSSVTVTYDPVEAARQRAISAHIMADFAYKLAKEYERIESGYLKRTVIYPGQTLMGYINVDRDRSYNVFSDFVILQGVQYQFTWNVD